MSKLEEIRKRLSQAPDIIWWEEEERLPYLRRAGSYQQVSFRVASRLPLPTPEGVQRFTSKLMQQLIPIGPVSLSRCYQFPAVKRQILRLGTLYFCEELNPSEEQGGNSERWIVLSIYPCEEMAKAIGLRGLVELRGFDCPNPCARARRCAFRSRESLTQVFRS